jgi:hydrogenase/urease accessory protein HupE
LLPGTKSQGPTYLSGPIHPTIAISHLAGLAFAAVGIASAKTEHAATTETANFTFIAPPKVNQSAYMLSQQGIEK